MGAGAENRETYPLQAGFDPWRCSTFLLSGPAATFSVPRSRRLGTATADSDTSSGKSARGLRYTPSSFAGPCYRLTRPFLMYTFLTE